MRSTINKAFERSSSISRAFQDDNSIARGQLSDNLAFSLRLLKTFTINQLDGTVVLSLMLNARKIGELEEGQSYRLEIKTRSRNTNPFVFDFNDVDNTMSFKLPTIKDDYEFTEEDEVINLRARLSIVETRCVKKPSMTIWSSSDNFQVVEGHEVNENIPVVSTVVKLTLTSFVEACNTGIDEEW